MAAPAKILAAKFPYQPTGDQRNFFQSTDTFIKSAEERCTLLVNGYAGTGKTSLLGALVRVLPIFRYKTVLLAPTGRAAKVMSRYTGRAAYTIHKKIYRLKESAESGGVKFILQKNYHRRTIFIVDEASMIWDEEASRGGVLYDLLCYVFQNPDNKLILVGDDAQLPPVGQDHSFALSSSHLRNKYKLKVISVNLKEVMRQALDSGILHNANKLRALDHNGHFQFNLTAKDIFRVNGERMEDGLRYAYDKYGLDDTAVICRTNRNAAHYNQAIRRSIFFYENEIECGDRIMVVKNNYFYKPENSPMGFLANGDFAEVLKIKRFEELYQRRFADLEVRLLDDPDQTTMEVKIILDSLYSKTASMTQEEQNAFYQEVRMDYADISNKKKVNQLLKENPYLQALQVKFAYALTCHKSQGGQWKAIFLDQGYLPEVQLNQDQIRWLYTGVTRATDELFLVNFKNSFF